MNKDVKNKLWGSAQLLLAFHKDRKGRRRPEPKVWPPKEAFASINDDGDSVEAFVDVRSVDRKEPHDVQIKIKPNVIVVCRDDCAGWLGAVFSKNDVKLSVNGKTISVQADGSLCIADEFGTTKVTVSSDDGVGVYSDSIQTNISPDGLTVVQKTPTSKAFLSPSGAYFEKT